MSIKFVSNLDEVLSAFEQQIKTALEKCGMDAESYAKRYETAVDTGRLRNSITHATQENPGIDVYSDKHGNTFSGGSTRGNAEEHTVVIGTNVEYAGYIENGTSKMDSRPFLKPALANHLKVATYCTKLSAMNCF